SPAIWEEWQETVLNRPASINHRRILANSATNPSQKKESAHDRFDQYLPLRTTVRRSTRCRAFRTFLSSSRGRFPRSFALFPHPRQDARPRHSGSSQQISLVQWLESPRSRQAMVGLLIRALDGTHLALLLHLVTGDT